MSAVCLRDKGAIESALRWDVLINVKADNLATIRCYERLGFETLAEYEENMAQLKRCS